MSISRNEFDTNSAEISFFKLRFPGWLEKKFREDYFHSSLVLLRVSFLLGLVYFSLFTLLDSYAFPEIKTQLFKIRFLIVCPVILTVLILSFHKSFSKWWQIAASAAVIVAGYGIVFMMIIIPTADRYQYYAGIILILIYCYMLIRLRFIWSSGAGLVIVLLFLASTKMFPEIDHRTFYIDFFFLFTANLLGMFGGFVLEYYTRKEFYFRYLLKRERKNVETDNTKLEAMVYEKTAELQEDIKKRELAERASRESSKNFQQLAENIDQVFWLTDWINKKLIYVSPSYEKVFELSVESAFNDRMSWENVIHPEDKDMVENIFAQSGSKETYAEAEYRIITPSGKIKWLYDRSYPVNDTEGKVVRFATIAEDITLRKAAELTLRKSEEKFRTITETIPGAVYRCDMEWTFQFASSAIERLTGYPSEDFINNEVRSYVSIMDVNDDEMESIQTTLNEAIEKRNKYYSSEYKIKTREGDTKWVHDSVGIIYDDDDKAIGFEGVILDVTDRIEAELAVKEKEKKYSDIVTLAPIGFYQTKRNGDFLFANEQMARTLGYENSLELLANSSIKDLYFENERENVIKKYDEKGDGKVFNIEVKFKKKDGQPIWVLLTSQAIKDTDGKTEYYDGFVIDITDRKIADDIIRDSEIKYRSVVDNMTEGIFVLKDNQPVYINHALEKITNFTSEKLFQMNIFDFVHEDDKQLMAVNYQRRANGEFIPSYDLRMRRQNGDIFWININGAQIKWENSPATLYFITEITDRKEAEATIIESENRLKLAAESSRIGIWDLDLVNNILVWDERMYELYGISEEDFGGAYETWQKGVHPDDLAEADKKVQDAIEGKEDFHAQFRVIWPDGSVHNLEAQAVISRDNNGKPLHMIGVNRDITEIKNAQDKIKTNLQEKNILIKELYHRTKNNMQVIASMLRLKSRTIEDSKSKEFFLEMVNKINSMSLAHQKLYAAKDLSHINMKEYIEDFVKLLITSYNIDEDRIQLITDMKDVYTSLDSSIPLGLVLSELISNIFKHAFTPDSNGEITLKLDRNNSGILVLELQDNGKGIPADTDLRKMSIMGLKYVFNLIEYQLKGKIDYHSDNGLAWKIEVDDSKNIDRV